MQGKHKVGQLIFSLKKYYAVTQNCSGGMFTNGFVTFNYL